METKEKVFTPEESMSLIAQSLANFKKNYRQKSKYTLLWGWVISLACLIHFGAIKYLLELEMYDKINLASILVWAIAIIVGYSIQIYFSGKARKQHSTLSHIDRVYIILWRTAGIGIMLAAIISVILGISPPPLIFILTGVATLASGWVIKFTPLIIGGISFFVFSIITAFVTNEYQLLLSALAIVIGHLVPGYLLRSAKE